MPIPKQLFRPRRRVRTLLQIAIVLIVALGWYFVFQGVKQAVYVACVPAALILVYLFGCVIVGEDDQAQRLWPEVAAMEDSHKVISRARRK